MNTQANTMPESIDSERVPVSSVTGPFFWSVRRELWENRSIYLAPLAVAAVFLFGFVITLVHLPAKMRGLSGLSPMEYRDAIVTPYDIAAGLMMLTAILVSAFYCLDALHGERRDRSILFWKSLPVSDLSTVLAKASVPIIILPVLTSIVGAALFLIMLLVSSVVLLGSGLSPAVLWTRLAWFQMSALLLYHILTAHALWPAPIYGWIMFVSGWARRAVLLWAIIPLVAIAALEAIVFRSSHFATMIAMRFIGGGAPANMNTPDDIFPTSPMTHLSPGAFLSSPGLWIGLAITAAFLIAAARLRRYRGPI